ncbi:hypothetical protein I4U23_020827 [Adineta vaga]|nr:hypothetical protein I4U23_020827 [Adineta vaga]
MDCRTLIEKYANDRDETVISQLGESLKTKKLSLLDFILNIGDYLQSTELSKRSIALILIANVLNSLPQTFLESHEIHHLLVFIIAKMTDHHILAQPAVDLFFILAKQSSITDEDCMIMIKSIFSDVYVQSFPQASRYNVFVILLHFLFTRLDVVRQLGSDFVCNFIQSMDGERDPRNLVLCFQCLQYMTTYLDIEPYKEELFEVVACYFPMEYKPKATSTEAEETITHEQLTLSLRNVLTSSDKFAKYCVPMLIEKLQSDIPSARLAAIDVFIHCIEEYDARDISSHLVPLWNLFSKQALCAENQETETNALRAITALMQLIGKSIQNDETEISTKKFVDRAIRECENFLKEPNSKLVWPATKVLQAVARANSTCASLIWSRILPSLMKQFENLEQITHKQTVLDMIIYFLQSTNMRTVLKLPPGISEELWILISTHFQAFPSYCLSLTQSLLQLNISPGQVLEDDLTKLILQENIDEQLKIKLATILRMLASSVIFDRICTNLLTNLINSWTVTKTIPSNETLESCVDLCHNSERCQERLERFFFPSEKFFRLLPGLFKYLSPLYILTNLFTPLFDLLLTLIDHDSTAKTFCAKCGAIADESCKPLVQNLYRNNLFEDSMWQLDKQGNLLLMIKFIGSLKRKVFQDDLEIILNEIKEKLLERIFNQPTNEINIIFCYFLANLINKLSSKNEIIELGQSIIKQCETSPDEKHIYLWTILVKALILSRPSTIEQYIPKLMSWLNEKNKIGEIACHSLKVLTNIEERSLLLSSFQADCIVHPMVKQLVFMKILSQMKPFLVNNDLSPNQMNVLIDLLNHIPKTIIQDEIISLLPVLIRALASSNESIWSSTLTSISDLIKSKPDSIVDHIDTLLPRLTTLAIYEKDMSIRITSLKCLKYLTALPIHKIQPYRHHIIHILKKCVDDHKRLMMSEDTSKSFSLEDDVETSDLNNGDSSNNDDALKIEDNQWIDDLRVALERGCDLGAIRNIAKCRSLTEDLRLDVWKICLDINETTNELEFNDSNTLDLSQQNIIREDISRLLQSSQLDKDLFTTKTDDIEAVITYYCKKHNETYEKGNGWIEIFKPLVTLNYQDRSELYALFSNIRNRYIPRDCEADGMPYHLFRLLLLYHDPELCSFFDTRKITSDLYAHIWIRSLYAGSCPLNIALPLWDAYFQQADQFFAFFLALVLLMFAKEHLLEMADKEKHEIIAFLSKAPANLTIPDLDDFCSLANLYATNTPQSFRKEFYSCLFNEIDRSFSQTAYSIYQALCLPVSVKELLQANQLGGAAGVRYFIVDCRPADQYNSKHLCTAFHLDANLLLEDPKEFAVTVDALLATQQNAIDAGSTAGGEHLCFMGSGYNEEDKYLRMVVAYFLQRNIKYVSIASGGYKLLASTIEDPSMLTPSNQHTTNESKSIGSTLKNNITEKLPAINTQTVSILNMISSAVKTKSLEVKGKVKDYMAYTSHTDSSHSQPRHVSKQDRIDKLYRQNQTSIFSLDGDDDDDNQTLSQQRESELVDIETWFQRNDLIYKYECEHFDENDKTHPSFLLASATHLYILRKLPEHKTMANLVSRRLLTTITKITSKKNIPEIITFRYATSPEEDEEQEKAIKFNQKNTKMKIPIDCDKIFVADAGDATKNIKVLIMKALNMYENSNEPRKN